MMKFSKVRRRVGVLVLLTILLASGPATQTIAQPPQTFPLTPPEDSGACPADMVDLEDFCIDRSQITEGRTWYKAADFCHARGKRLCSISEWITACDGSPINGVEDMPGRQSQWVDSWVYETSTQVFDAVDHGFFRCSSISHPWTQYRPLESKWFRCCADPDAP